MHAQGLFVAAVVGARVALADWVVMTHSAPKLPTPSFKNEKEGASWTRSVQILAASVASSIEAKPEYSSFQEARMSISSELGEFYKTATYSFPAEPSAEIAIYTTVPEWFSELPEDVKEFKSAEASFGSILDSAVIAAIEPVTSAPANATASSSGSASPASRTASGIVTESAPTPAQPSQATATASPTGAASRGTVELGARLLASLAGLMMFL